MSELEKTFRHFVARLFIEKAAGPDGFMHAGAGLAGEAGEVLDHIKKHWVYGRDLDRGKVIEEMGDVLHYFTQLMLLLDADLSEIAIANMEKLQKRYPNEFSKEAALKRADVDKSRLRD